MRKRILVMILSFGAIIAFGYALGGLGSYLVGQKRPLVIAAGLVGGVASSFAAMRVWRSYLSDIAAEDAEKEREERPL